jgi:hypothetical protein
VSAPAHALVTGSRPTTGFALPRATAVPDSVVERACARRFMRPWFRWGDYDVAALNGLSRIEPFLELKAA